MNWQELSVFFLVAGAAIYLSREFIKQFGERSSAQQPACAKCSGCNTTTPAEPTPQQTLIQISRSTHV